MPKSYTRLDTQTSKHLRSGTAIIELAAALPTLLLITLGCIDYGRVFYYQSAVVNAARAGAHTGAMTRRIAYAPQYWRTLVDDAVRDEVANVPNFDAADLVSDVAFSTDAEGLQITSVSVSYTFRTLVEWPGIDGTVSLHHQVVMRQLR